MAGSAERPEDQAGDCLDAVRRRRSSVPTRSGRSPRVCDELNSRLGLARWRVRHRGRDLGCDRHPGRTGGEHGLQGEPRLGENAPSLRLSRRPRDAVLQYRSALGQRPDRIQGSRLGVAAEHADPAADRGCASGRDHPRRRSARIDLDPHQRESLLVERHVPQPARAGIPGSGARDATMPTRSPASRRPTTFAFTRSRP